MFTSNLSWTFINQLKIKTTYETVTNSLIVIINLYLYSVQSQFPGDFTYLRKYFFISFQYDIYPVKLNASAQDL